MTIRHRDRDRLGDRLGGRLVVRLVRHAILAAAVAALPAWFVACAHKPADGSSGSGPGAAGASPLAPAHPASSRKANPARNAHQVSPTVVPEGPDAIYWKNRADLIAPPPAPRPTALTLPRVERWKLPNGLDVVAVPRQGLPIVSFSIAIKAGGYDEQKGRSEGAADFTAAMLRKGTRKRTADRIADAIDGVGGALDASAGMESTGVSCSALAKHAGLCLDLLTEMLLQPVFPESEMPEIRDQMLAAIASRVDDPHLLAAEHFDNLLFGDDHPDGWVLTAEHVRAITRQTLLGFWKSFYRPNNAMLAVAGDFDVATMKAAIARAFGKWTSAEIPPRPPFQVAAVRGKRAILVDKPDLTQATLMCGHRGIRHADPDWYAATLVNYVLGGSDFSSRLMIEVRSKRGLTYGIGSSFGATLYEGAFRISAATRTETAWDAFAVTVEEIRKMKAGGPSADELVKAKGYYAGSIPFELESAAGLARGIVTAELHGLGLAYVQQLPVRLGSVDLLAARAAAQRWLDPDNMDIVIVGRASLLEPQIRKGGLTFEKVDYRAPISAAARRAARSPEPQVPSSP